MYQRIHDSLFRQTKALALLRDLLEEEYEVLLGRDTNTVASLEFSIQELIRQLAVEKALVIRSLNGEKVLAFAETQPEERKEALRELYRLVDDGEQAVSRHASRNAQLSLALLDQSTHTLNVLTNKVAPNLSGTYGRNGDMRNMAHPQAALISGRL